MPEQSVADFPSAGPLRRALHRATRWIDSDYFSEGVETVRAMPERVEFRRLAPFLFLHLGCIGVIWVGWSWTAVSVAAALYLFRMFAITAFYHRYFSHRAFRTSRWGQFIFAVLGSTAVQRGALWWAAVHRRHHQHADHDEDVHSPSRSGFWWAHIGWMTSSRNFPTDYNAIRDLAKYPELVFLNRFDLLVPTLFGAGLYGLGAIIERCKPDWGTSGAQIFVWGFFISTVVLLHGTLFVNSLAHAFGVRRFATADDSRNNLFLALLTLGEGWHNNHHRYMASTRQGFYWWEVDITFYVLKALACTGLIWDLKPVPRAVLEEGRQASAAGD